MQTIELQTRISSNGHIQLPKAFGFAYGREAKLVVILPESTTKKKTSSATRQRKRRSQNSCRRR